MSDAEYTAQFRFPTTQFAYIEIEAHGTQESLLEQYRAFESKLKGGEGVDDKTFDVFVENMISGQTNKLSTFTAMSPEQQGFVNVVKRAVKRLNSRVEKAENL